MLNNNNSNTIKPFGSIYKFVLNYRGTDYPYIGKTRKKISYRLNHHAIRETGLSRWVIDKLDKEQNPNRKRNSVKPKPIVLDGIEYSSISTAARELGLSIPTIKNRFRKAAIRWA